MADIVLATLNARYIHTAFGLRYLRASLGALRERSVIFECDALVCRSAAALSKPPARPWSVSA